MKRFMLLLLLCGMLVGPALPSRQPAALAAPSALPLKLDYVDNIGGGIPAIAVVGSYAYVGEGAWLTVMDISNPDRFVQRARVQIPEMRPDSYFLAAKAQGEYLYLVDWHIGLTIIDISQPTAPFVSTQLDIVIEDTVQMAIDGTRLYIGTSLWGTRSSVEVIDITNPAQATSLGSISFILTHYDIAIKDNLLYAVFEYGLMEIYNVEDVTNYALVGSYERPDGQAIKSVILENDRAYLAISDGSLDAVDVHDPASPQHVGGYTPTQEKYATGDLQVKNGLIYTPATYAGATQGLGVIDLSDPQNSQWIGTVETNAAVQEIQLLDGWLSVVDESTWQLVDMHNLAAPVIHGRYPVIGSGSSIEVLGDQLLVPAAGLQVLDLSVPGATMQRTIYPEFLTGQMQIKNGLAYASYGGSVPGLHIFDVQSTDTITRVGHYDLNTYVTDLQIVGSLAYVALGDDGLKIIDVSEPGEPQLVGSIKVETYTSEVQVRGNLAYVLAGAYNASITKLCIVRISNPAAPVELGCYNHHDRIGGNLAVVNDLVYIPGEQNLKLIDVSTPTAPVLRATYEKPSSDVRIAGSRVYLTVDDGLEILDFSKPGSPVLLGKYKGLNWRGGELEVVRDTIYVGAGTLGLHILKIRGPQPTLALDAFTGQPGSSFTLQGHHFGEAAEVSIIVNGMAIGSVTARATGSFSATLSTAADATAGLYAVTALQTPAGPASAQATTSYMLKPDAPLREPAPVGTALAVPAAIAPLQLRATYLPLAAR